MNLEKGARVDPCWGALNNDLMILEEEGERRVKARQKWVRRLFGKKKKVGDGKGGRVSWSQRPRLRRNDRLMKKRRISHPDEEDPGAICALFGAMKLNVWGGEKDYSVSLEQEEEKSDGKGRTKRARKRRV